MVGKIFPSGAAVLADVADGATELCTGTMICARQGGADLIQRDALRA